MVTRPFGAASLATPSWRPCEPSTRTRMYGCGRCPGRPGRSPRTPSPNMLSPGRAVWWRCTRFTLANIAKRVAKIAVAAIRGVGTQVLNWSGLPLTSRLAIGLWAIRRAW
jgi:hypothetical protein